MKRIDVIACILAVLTVGAPVLTVAEGNSVLDFTMKSIDGQDISLSTYRGKVLMIINVASKCGLTPQYKGLEALYEKYGEQGLVILGFPANNFGAQEPGTNEEIRQFCTLTYGVKFPMFAKISVKGEDIHPLYTFLTGEKTNPKFAGDIKWNFTKFLVDRSGKVINRFEPKVTPDSDEIVKAVEAALAAK
ncbi:MAG: glutathione peroxidase [Candidatus Latescibacter sp.]|nr:glutathione peroxidase [Candidatus Latescibacter sp.]